MQTLNKYKQIQKWWQLKKFKQVMQVKQFMQFKQINQINQFLKQDKNFCKWLPKLTNTRPIEPATIKMFDA